MREYMKEQNTRTAIIACETLRDEIVFVKKHLNIELETVWIQGNLHNYPERLRKSIQDELDLREDYDRILLAFGLCGNAVVGLQSRHSEIIMPKVDDCISMILGSMDRRKEISVDSHSFFLTKGWLDHDPNVWDEYVDTMEKYGDELGMEVMQAMYGNYQSISVIETQAYDIGNVYEQAKRMADAFEFRCLVIPGTLSYLETLITGPWDNKDFLRIPPGSVVKAFECL